MRLKGPLLWISELPLSFLFSLIFLVIENKSEYFYATTKVQLKYILMYQYLQFTKTEKMLN